jgi:hypothetical protein
MMKLDINQSLDVGCRFGKPAEKAAQGIAPGKKFPLERPWQVSVNHSCLASERTAPHPLASGSARNLVLR